MGASRFCFQGRRRRQLALGESALTATVTDTAAVTVTATQRRLRDAERRRRCCGRARIGAPAVPRWARSLCSSMCRHFSTFYFFVLFSASRLDRTFHIFFVLKLQFCASVDSSRYSFRTALHSEYEENERGIHRRKNIESFSFHGKVKRFFRHFLHFCAFVRR